jgi:hypothetical protein
MADVPKDVSQWRGMSGAVVVGCDPFGRMRVFGAVQEVNDMFRHGKLYVARIADAFEETGFREALAEALGEEPGLQKAAERSVVHVPRVGSQERIYATFRSAHQTLHGRGRELDTLAKLLFPANPVNVIAVNAIGGMGKTALARECCIVRDVWKSYDIVLGVQAPKRQIAVKQLGPARPAIRELTVGSVLGTSQFMIEIARQLGLPYPDSRNASELERDILRGLADRRVLFILDNLETMENTLEMLSVLNRMCSPPARKALITTREVPDDDSLNMHALHLESIEDETACRELVLERMSEIMKVDSQHEFLPAIDAILDVARGHPLALELLTSKLMTQGRGPIMELRGKWRNDFAGSVNDEFLATLCDYAFDTRFKAHIGDDGCELLSVIADEDFGVSELELFAASELSREDFDSLLTRVFRAGCIYRQPHGERIVLMMHPLTQAHFRSRIVRG